MKYYVDQSGKIEDTSKDTVLAYSNSKKVSILIHARDKRRLQEKFRLVGTPGLFVYTTFAIAVYLLIKPEIKSRSNFIIDIEYSGYTRVIEDMIRQLSSVELYLKWKLIGKNSQAHDTAYKTYKKKIKPSKIVTVEDIWRLANKASKTLSKIKETGGRLNPTTLRENRRSAPVMSKIYHKVPKKSRNKK